MSKSFGWFVLALYIPTLCTSVGFGIVSPILPLFAQDFGVSYAEVGLLLSVVGFARLFTDLPVAVAMDRYGRRPFLIHGLTLLSFGSIISGLAPDYTLLLLGRVLTGLGAGFTFSSAQTVITEATDPSKRGKIISGFSASARLGFASGPFIGGVSVALWGFRSAFFILAALSALSAVLSYLKTTETKPDTVGEVSFNIFKSLRGMGKEGIILTFVAVSVANVTVSFRMGAWQTLLPLYADNRLRMDVASIGAIIGLAEVSNLGLVPLMGWVMDRYGRKASFVPGSFVCSVCLYLTTFTQNAGELYVVAIILGIGTGLIGSAIWAMTADIAPISARASFLGVSRLIQDGSIAVIPLILGATADTYGLNLPFYLSAIFTAFASFFVLFFSKETLKISQDRQSNS